MKHKKILLVLSLLFVIGFVGCSHKNKDLVAKVNGEEITKEEYNMEFKVNEIQYKRIEEEKTLAKTLEEEETMDIDLKKRALNSLIFAKVLEQEAYLQNIKVTDKELNEKLDTLYEEIGGEKQLNNIVKEDDIPEEYFLNHIKRLILIEKFKENYTENINIDNKRSKEYFDTNHEKLILYHLKHILVESEEKGQKALNMIEKGEDFGEVAIKASKDSVSSIDGGDIGYLSEEDMPKEIKKAVLNLEVGQVSDLINTELGYHIIYLEDKKDSLDELKNTIEKEIKE